MIKKILLAIVALVVLAVAVFFAPGLFVGDLTNETRLVINKPRDEVWDKFQDDSKMGEWLKNFKSIETVEGKPRTVGSKHRITFDMDGEEIVMMQTMTAFNKGESFAFKLENETMYSEIDVRLNDKGLVTELVQKEKYHGQNVLWHSMFYWLKSWLAENSRENMENFKKYAEGA